jgi:hypothetical protein
MVDKACTLTRGTREHGRQCEHHRQLQRRPAPLEQAHGQRVGAGARQRQAQRRRAGMGRRGLGPHDEGRALVRLRGQLQPAQGLALEAGRRPRHDRARLPAAQRPQQVVAADHHAARQVESQLRQRLGAGLGRRPQQEHASPGRAHACEHRREESDLTPARASEQELCECSLRPATARQLGIERGIAARVHRLPPAPQLVRAPQRRMQMLQRQQGRRRGHDRADVDAWAAGGRRNPAGRVVPEPFRSTVFAYSLSDL